MFNRRQFIGQSAIVAAGLVFTRSLQAATAPGRRLTGIQLYTLRDEIPRRGLRDTLAMVAAAGYQNVELYGYHPANGFFGHRPEEVAAMLRAFRLRSTSGHYDLNLFADHARQLMQVARVLGHRYVVIPWLAEEERKSAADYRVIAGKLNRAGRLCRRSGLRLAYHNHDFEFEKMDDGSCGYDILLKEVPPALMDMELDLFWAVKAGYDPVQLFRRHPGRFALWHVKDRDAGQPDRNTEIGSGSIDFKKIFAQASVSGLKYFYMEQEHFATDPEMSIQKSHDYIRKHLLPAWV